MFEPIQQSFHVQQTEQEIPALLIHPDNATHLLLLAHGAGAGMSHRTMESIAQAMGSRKIATLRYNFPFILRGGGRDSRDTTLATIAAAYVHAKQAARGLPLLAGGHSFGGRMTSHAIAENLLQDVMGVVYCGFPLHPPKKPGIERAAHLQEVRTPQLFLSGTRDALASSDLLKQVVAHLKDQATLHWLDTADHSYKILKRSRQSSEDIFDEMARVTREWIDSTF